MLGTGIFTPGEAAALLHEETETVRRWAFGYHRQRRAGRVEHPPLIHTDLPEMEGLRALTFVELIELLYVRAFLRVGASWTAVREAARTASKMFCTEHPFALRQLYVDPTSIYGAIREADGSESLVQLVGAGQMTIPQLIKPYLSQIEFEDDVAARWHPMGKGTGVVVDPARSFGAPVIDEVGIRAESLSAAVAAELPVHGEAAVEYVAWTYEVEHRHVNAALRFQQWLNRAA